MSLLLAVYRSTVIPPTAHSNGQTAPSTSPSTSLQGHSRVATGTNEGTPGVTPGMTPVGAGGNQARASLGSVALGRTPSAQGGHHGASASISLIQQVHTPVGMAQTPAGRTPSNNPRTPGTVNKHTRTPTATLKDNKRPGQIRAEVFYEKLILGLTALVAEEGKPQKHAAEYKLPSGRHSRIRAFALGKVIASRSIYQSV